MSLLGKILAVFNIFGVLGLLVLAIADYGKRQAWAYSVLRHDLVLTGLPLDANESDPQGNPRSDALSEETLKAMFQPVGGSPVLTQVDEVARVKKDFTARLASMTGQDGKPQVRQQTLLLARVLLPLADSYTEREEMLACRHYFATDATLAALRKRYEKAFTVAQRRATEELVGPGKQPMIFEEAMHMEMRAQRGEPSGVMTSRFVEPLPVAAAQVKELKFGPAWDACLDAQLKSLTDRLEQKMTRVQMGPTVPGVGSQPGKDREVDQKRAIGRLLFALCLAHAEDAADADQNFKGVIPGSADFGNRVASSEAYKRQVQRVYVVSGLRTVLAVTADEADQMKRLATECGFAQDRDLATFVSDNIAVIEELRDRAEMVAAEENRVKENTTKLAGQKVLVEKRKADVASLQAELKESRQKTLAAALALREFSADVLKRRQEVRQAIADTEKAEKQVVKLENIIRAAERSQSQGKK